MELPSLPPIPESAARSHSCDLASALDAEHGESGRSRPASSSLGRSSDEPPARPVDWQGKVRVSNHFCVCRGADGALPSLRRPYACAHQLRVTSCVNVMPWTDLRSKDGVRGCRCMTGRLTFMPGPNTSQTFFAC